MRLSGPTVGSTTAPRRRRWRPLLPIGAVVAGISVLVPSAALKAQSSQAAVWTQHNDNSRTGANLNETILTPSNVNVNQFGRLFSRAVDGQIYAQPLYVPNVTIGGVLRNVVFVATMKNNLYAYDADDPAATTPYWQLNFGAPVPNADVGGLEDIQGPIGITSTPVIDTATGTLYCVAKTKEGTSASPIYVQRLHALDLRNGQERPGSPVVIDGTVPGTGDDSVAGTIRFNPLRHLNRPALLLANGYLYLAYGSHEDQRPYHGWVLSYNASTLQQVGVYNDSPNGWGGGIWSSGQGLVADDAGAVYFMTANGTFTRNTGGPDCSTCFVKLSTPSLSVVDWFAPYNQSMLNANNYELNTSGPLLLPGTHNIIGGGKEGKLYVLNRDNMGHFLAGADTQILQELQMTFGDHLHGSPIYYMSPTLGPMIYLWYEDNYLEALEVSNGLIQATTDPTTGLILPFMRSPMKVPTGMPGGVLSLSANGNVAGTGIVWATAPYALDAHTATVAGIVRAFDANNLSTVLWDSKQNAARDDFGDFAKFTPPTIANGKVYLATFSNQLLVYGLLGGPPPAPVVTSVFPGTGPTTGGTTITISGTNFATGATVTVGGAAAGSVTVVNSTTITGTTPAHTAGAVSVTVTNPDSQSDTRASAFTYTPAAPVINTVTPGSGPLGGGTTVTIGGSGFAAGATVTIGGTTATGIVVNATTITATTPAHGAGAVAVTVSNPDAQSGTLNNGFTYLGPAPTVGGVSPTNGPTDGGTAVTITGTNFAAGATVTIGNVAATSVVVATATTITAATAAHAAGTVSVTVTNADAQSATLANSFTYTSTAPPPTVTTVAPTSGAASGGTALTVTGTNFAAGATVNVGGTAATAVTVVNATTITATTPAHAAGLVGVTVTNTDGQNATLANAFTYIAPPAGVVFDAVGPSAAGISVVSGSSLSWTHTVGAATNALLTVGVAVGRSPDSGLTLAVAYNGVPMTSAGIVHANSRTDGFVQLFYLAGPAEGAHTVQVALTGGTASIEAGSVSFSGVDQTTPVRNIAVANGAGATPTVTVTSAPGDMVVDAMVTGCTGTITSSRTLRWLNEVNCATAGGNGAQSTATGASSVAMSYTVPSDWWGIIGVDVVAAATAPPAFDFTLSNQGNTSVVGGSAVGNSITATLSSGTTQPVTFSVSGLPAGVSAGFSPGSCSPTCGTLLTLTASASATLGTSTITVTVTDGSVTTHTTTFSLTVLAPAPTVTGMSPTSGPTSGGTAITITGTGFSTGATVSAGGTAATAVTVVNATTITATTPAHVAGAVAVTVTNSDAQSGSRPNAFTYVAPAPTVTSVAPTSGSTGGGTAITITGTGFAAGASVTIGSTAATGVTVANATTIAATTPAHAAGAVPVTVTNSDAQSGSLTGAFTYVTPAPTVTSVAPTSGSTGGGTAITITGTGFAAGATVSVGGTAATGVTGVNATTITATTPAHAAGAVAVTVTNADAQSGTRAVAFTYLAPAPTVTSVSPTSGPTAGGTAITVSGTGFSTGATVSVGGTAATGVTVVDATTITATTPAHTLGAVAVTVTNTDTQSGSVANAFTYVAPAPTVTSVAPTSGSTGGGTAITITGTGFAAGASVTIGGTAATGVTVVNATTITATTPTHAAGAVTATVTNSDAQSGSLASAFTYVTPPPSVTSVAPPSGPTAGGTAITISGIGFAAGATVSVGGTAAASVTLVSATTITATTPAHAAGAVSVAVTNSDAQSGTLANAFTYLAPAPTVTGVAPTSGSTAGGTPMTISGTGFSSGATVSVGGTAATGITVVDASTITATTPAHPAGAIAVAVTNSDTQSGSLANAFTYIAPPPTVSGVTPGGGSTGGGTVITIGGTGFAAGATVSVGGTNATGVTVVNATTITATTPAHAAGAVTLTVTNTDAQSGTLANAFTYVTPPPTVTSVAPTSGPTAGGTAITISGTGFVAGAAVSVGGTAAADVTVVNATTITATTPAHAAGAVSVTVTNSDTQSGTLAGAFTYGAPITRIGGWTEIQSATNAATATVTVPSDATMMVVFVTGYRTGTYFSNGNVTIGGASMTVVGAESNNSAFKGAAFYRALPKTGVQTLAWDWAGTATPAQGVILAYGFYKNDGGALRDAEGKQSSSGAAVTSRTLTASPGDLIVSWRFGFWPYVDPSFTFSWSNATKVADFDVASGYRKATASLAETSPSGSQTVTGIYGGAADGGLITLVIKGSGG